MTSFKMDSFKMELIVLVSEITSSNQGLCNYLIMI